MVNEATAASLLRKLGEFGRSLDRDERELFAALIGPGVSQAIGRPDVEGFAAGQESDRLVRALTALASSDQPDIDDSDGR